MPQPKLTPAQENLLRTLQSGVIVRVEIYGGKRNYYRCDTDKTVNRTIQILWECGLFDSINSRSGILAQRYLADMQEMQSLLAEAEAERLHYKNSLDHAKDIITEVRQEVQVLTEALQPFADKAKRIDSHYRSAPLPDTALTDIPVGNLRRAAEALASIGQSEKTEELKP